MRKFAKWLAIGALLATGSSALIAAGNHAPTTKPEHAAKLTKPWSELSDLTEDQKSQILAIHQKANEDRDAINKKEREDIEAVLTDDQKKELADSEAKAREEAMAKRHHHDNAEPATKPAG